MERSLADRLEIGRVQWQSRPGGADWRGYDGCCWRRGRWPVLRWSGYKRVTLATRCLLVLTCTHVCPIVRAAAETSRGGATAMPHAVVRLYTDSGPLIGMLKERQDEVRDIMTGVPGFMSYGI